MADLLSLQRPDATATLLFVVNASAGVVAGEAFFDTAQLSTLDSSIKAKRFQVPLYSLPESLL